MNLRCFKESLSTESDLSYRRYLLSIGIISQIPCVASRYMKIDIIQDCLDIVHEPRWNVIFRWTLPSSSSGSVQQRSSLNCRWKPILTWLTMLLLDGVSLGWKAALNTMWNWILKMISRDFTCIQLYTPSHSEIWFTHFISSIENDL